MIEWDTLTIHIDVVRLVVQELAWYTVKVRIEATWGGRVFTGPWAVLAIEAKGKYLPPGDVPWVKAFEANGEVFIRWGEAQDIDIWRYEARYAPVGAPWDDPQREIRLFALAPHANGNHFITLVDALSYRTKEIPEGRWDIMIKAVDSVGNQSLNEARVTIDVIHDIDLSNYARYAYQQSVGSTNVYQYRENGRDVYVSDCGVLWDQLFPNLLDSYTQVLDTYTNCESEYLSEIHNWGRYIDGTWQMSAFDYEALGASTLEPEIMRLQTQQNGWEVHGDSAVVNADQSQARLKATAGNAFRLTIPEVEVRVMSEPKSQSGRGIYTAPGPTRITLAKQLHAFSSIVITPVNTGANLVVGVAENLTTGANSGFDVHLIDANNAKRSGEFLWKVEGI